jgi:multimeric flavodoxin WrbA
LCWLRGQSLIFNPSFAENQRSDTTEPKKPFLTHTMMFVGSIWKNKSGWFLFVRSLGLSVATEIVMTAMGPVTDFQPKSCYKSTSHDTTEPKKPFFVHTMVFVGSIWKNKSGWFLFVTSPGLSVAAEIVLTAGVHH